MRRDRFLPDFQDMLVVKAQKEITSYFVNIVLELRRSDDGL